MSERLCLVGLLLLAAAGGVAAEESLLVRLERAGGVAAEENPPVRRERVKNNAAEDEPDKAAGEASPLLRWVREGKIVAEFTWRSPPEPCPEEEPAPSAQFACWAPGERLGRVRLHGAWVDRRGQTIPPGDYVLRYALQPFSKNHAATTLHRDFLVLVRQGDDPGGKILEEEDLWRLGRLASGTSHPAILEIRLPPAPPQEGESLVEATIDTEKVLLVLEAPEASGGPF